MPLWERKFINWKAMQATCNSAAGPNGIYCLWAGKNCSYETCPRRIFEEVTIDIDSLPVTVPERLRERINAQDVKIAEIQQQVKFLIEELKKPPWEVKIPI